MMMITVDNRIVEAACGGDCEALEYLIRVARPDVRRYAGRYCVASDVDDAVQESLIIMSRRLPALRTVTSFTGWLFQIARRECQRMARKMLHQEVPLDEVLEQRYLSRNEDLELRMDIASAIQSLPDHYRETIVLRDFEELTIAEIGQRLGLSPDTIKTRLRRSRVLIREHLLA
ncbi:MAG: sigma-70 family polymerase sigma factor [Capsulimonas sp.]|jgi:RNA polymerase sigma factor (sigma-70 family)|nr:sigma-70 family polymerase sigma factor [Capsulimonas sp.]